MDIWEGDHLSELALSCIADGQDVVDPVAREHAESCVACAARVGAMALESHDVGVALKLSRGLARAPAVQHRFPTWLVAAATLLAISCGLPMLSDEGPRAVTWVFASPRLLPILANAVLSSTGGASLSIFTTFALALCGLAVARAASRQGVTS